MDEGGVALVMEECLQSHAPLEGLADGVKPYVSGFFFLVALQVMWLLLVSRDEKLPLVLALLDCGLRRL